MTAAPAVTVHRVSKRYKGLQAVCDLSFQVRKAESYGLLGPNGAGKTTLMHMLYGRVRRDPDPAGSIRVFGCDPRTDELQIKFIAGIVPQENNLDQELSVVQNLLVYARFYGFGKKQILPRIEHLLAFMELYDKKNARIRELSGGLQRRLIIARALIHQPLLLILDEPTTGLDPQVRHVIWDKIHQLKQDGTTILLTTHYMEEAFQLCDRLLILHNGRPVMEGRPAQLVRENMEPYVLEIFRPEKYIRLQPPPRVRKEATDRRILLYAGDPAPLEDLSRSIAAGDFFLRQSNLEDLFLKATGRKLYE